LSALRAGMLEKVRRAKGERRCWVKAARRRDIMGVWEMRAMGEVCIGWVVASWGFVVRGRFWFGR
jgi:hypothetical protein